MIWSKRWSPENLLRRESGEIKVGFVVQKPHVSGILKMKNFGGYARWGHLSKFFRPCRGLLAERSHPLMEGDMACGDDSFFVSRIVQAIFLSQGAFAKFWSKRKSATWWHVLIHNLGFAGWISLGFRRCGVNTLRNDMPRALSAEDLLRTESGGVKVGFVVQNMHVLEIFKLKNFGEWHSLRALV